MKKTLLLLLFLFSVNCCLHAQFYNKRFGGWQNQIEMDNNKNLVILSSSSVYKNSSANDTVLWERNFPDTVSNPMLGVHGNSIYLSYTHALAAIQYVTVLKLDENGQTVWAKNLKGTSNLTSFAMCVTKDNRVVIGSGNCSYHSTLIILDSLGNILLAKSYPTLGSSSVGTIIGLRDDGSGNVMAVCYYGDTNNHCVYKFFKIDMSGNILLSKYYNTGFVNIGAVGLGGLVIDSYKNTFYNNALIDDSTHAYYNIILNLDSLGSMRWSKTYSSPGWPDTFSGQLGLGASDSLLAVEGYTLPPLSNAAAVIKIDKSNGDVLSSIGTTNLAYRVQSVKYLRNDSLIIGESNGGLGVIDSRGGGLCNYGPFNVQSQDFSFTIDSLVTISAATSITAIDTILNLGTYSYSFLPFCTVGISELDNDLRISIYPNPAHNTLNVDMHTSTPLNVTELKIYDMTGRIVLDEILHSPLSTVNCPLSTGLYLVRVEAGDKVYQQKLVIE